MANIYLLRHGRVTGEAALYGHSDIAVADDTNSAIAAAFTQQGISLDSVISSPLQRCLTLAQLIAAQQNCQIQNVDALKEMDFGVYDGIAFDKLYQDQAIWQQLELFWQNPVQHPLPKAELLIGFSYRVIDAWQNIIAKLSHDQQPKNILLVCHGGVIRMILAHLLNVDYRNPKWYTQLSIAHASLTTIAYCRRVCRVVSIGKSLHGEVSEQDDHNDFVFDDLSSLLNSQEPL